MHWQAISNRKDMCAAFNSVDEIKQQIEKKVPEWKFADNDENRGELLRKQNMIRAQMSQWGNRFISEKRRRIEPQEIRRQFPSCRGGEIQSASR